MLELDALLEHVRPTGEQRGVLVAIGGKVRSLDLFDKPSTLAAHWDGLTAGYAIDAVAAEPGTCFGRRRRGVLQALAGAADEVHPGLGLGTDHLFRNDGLVGTAL